MADGDVLHERVDEHVDERVDEQGRPEPPAAGGEVATLLGFLDFHRATLEWKCAGLDTAGLTTRVGTSSMTLGGLLKHLAQVEDGWFTRDLLGREPAVVGGTGDDDGPRGSDGDVPGDGASRDDEWRVTAADTPDVLRARWREAVDRSRAAVAETLADGGLDRLADRTWPDGGAPSLRWILVHLIEEYARHNGHADLLRERIDGATGD